MEESTPNLRIGLLENCYHSLKRGYELWGEGERKKDGWLLKEAVFWIHHGIELGIKQLLVQTNEYLVFEDIDRAVEKLAKLRQRSPESSALDLFEQEEPAFSVGFQKAIERAAIMLDMDELCKKSELRKNIDELTKYRNKIAHYSVQLDINKVVILISQIMEDFLRLLENQVRDEQFRKFYLPEIKTASLPFTKKIENINNEVTARIVYLMKSFNKQTVPGVLFGLQEEVILPVFLNIEQENNVQYARLRQVLDIKAEANNQEYWVVQIKNNLRVITGIIQYLMKYKSSLEATEDPKVKTVRLWVVSLEQKLGESTKKKFRDSGILISSLHDIEKLENILNRETT